MGERAERQRAVRCVLRAGARVLVVLCCGIPPVRSLRSLRSLRRRAAERQMVTGGPWHAYAYVCTLPTCVLRLGVGAEKMVWWWSCMPGGRDGLALLVCF
ncbi:hypothetical protein IWZ00DRAFT_505739 [Phyllosticta capitalensis]